MDRTSEECNIYINYLHFVSTNNNKNTTINNTKLNLARKTNQEGMRSAEAWQNNISFAKTITLRGATFDLTYVCVCFFLENNGVF